MADSFFGFDTTTIPRDDDLGGGLDRELSEGEYDALNDETFNHAVKDDWEGGHETLVRIEHRVSNVDKLEDSDGDYDSDLDINFITKLDDFDITNDDTDIRNQFQLDPSVWTTPLKPPNPFNNNNKIQTQDSDASRKFQHQNLKANIQPPPGLSTSLAQQTNALQQLIGTAPAINAHPKILSVEEIERNMISQQQQQQHQKMMQEKLAAIQSKVSQVVVPPNSQPLIPQPPQQIRKVLSNQIPGQPGLVFQPPPHMNGPPPFGSLPPHLQGPNMSKFNPIMNMSNHPINMNSFHQNFGGPLSSIPRSQQIPLQMNRLPPHLINMQGSPLMYQQQQQQHQQQNVAQQNSAQFNQRLVQEIQQNHPMLNPMQFRNQNHQQYNHSNHNNIINNNNNNSSNNINQHQRFNNNGKMDEYDEYANLMSNRDKQFLITIQLMQLNTETPYFDDYYYTMYKERQRLRGIENESQAHRDNQLNHPFTQPKGHAQMLLRQFNNIGKNGMQNQKNGISRERHNSESSTKNDKENPTPRTYTPLQFENSLGKLQCGSVTAPRKIIDMEVVSNAENGQNAISDSTMQKRSRQILIYIEMLYKIVMKLEDLQHPLAIAATIILKEKREKQRILMEQEAKGDLEDISIGSTKSSISLNEPESQIDLMTKLLNIIQLEKIPGVLAVRKGRSLLKRLFPHIKDQSVRWDLWNAIFISLTIFKRDKLEEIEESLMILYYEFATQLQDADIHILLKLINNMMTSDKLMGYVNGCKFVVSSMIAMIIKCELLYQKSGDTINFTEEEQWIQFLNKLFEIVNNDRTVDAQIFSSANNVHRDKIDHDRIIRTVITNFQRFKPRFTSDDEKLIKLLSIQYDVK
ncbi:protein PAT1 homolog 1 [Chironomus tepperi]|uniref:protein PAT1 homolog 1 n=1 Tax=Chironomus tepperi TaxID=113505 RepID=UPI00391F3A84